MAISKTDAAAEPGADDATAQQVSHDRSWSSEHSVNLRLTLPIPFGPFYLVILGGRERRSPERRVQERSRHRLLTIGNFLVFLSLGTVAGLAILGLMQLLSRYALDAAGLASF